ncbi:hypothetical protein QYF36_026316 [Acer negundo]|nr:hypothetical protein QYF36_026316 [Acer negundo]
MFLCLFSIVLSVSCFVIPVARNSVAHTLASLAIFSVELPVCWLSVLAYAWLVVVGVPVVVWACCLMVPRCSCVALCFFERQELYRKSKSHTDKTSNKEQNNKKQMETKHKNKM